jgi:hypothetical protein
LFEQRLAKDEWIVCPSRLLTRIIHDGAFAGRSARAVSLAA